MIATKTVKDVDFGIFFFASSMDSLRGSKDLYAFLIDCVRFADQHGFSSAWIPERHFTEFGCIYPNPAQVLTGLATVTQKIRLCAGSLVSPLHNVLRIVEDWAVLDNMSKGRIGASFAPGWNPNDFVLYPERYADRRDENFGNVALVRRLWQGQPFRARNGLGAEVELKLFPPPYSAEFPLWITASGNPETFRMAGQLGTNVLTHLLDHELPALAEKIAIYRKARSEHGFDPDAGTVTAMIHSFVGEDRDAIREEARAPYCEFLKANANLAQGLAADRGRRVDLKTMSERDLDGFLNFLYDRFVFERAFIGSPESCVELAGRVYASGVDEIACLLDFGPPAERIVANLPHLSRLKDMCRALPNCTRQGLEAELRPSQRLLQQDGPAELETRSGGKDLEEIRRRLSVEISVATFYEALEQRGYPLEDAQRGLERLWTSDGEALGLVHLPERIKTDSGWPSSLLESCLPVAIAALPEASDPEAAHYVPATFRSLRPKKLPGRTVWSHAVLRSGPALSEHEREADVRILDETGQELLVIQALKLVRAEPLANGDQVGDWLYRERWEVSAPLSAAQETPGHWLILADRGGVGHAVARLLGEAGHSCSLLSEECLGTSLAARAALGAEHGATAALRQIFDAELSGASGKAATGIVYLWGLDVTPPEDTTPESLMADQFMAVGSVTLLIQAMVALKNETPPRLWIASSGAKSVSTATDLRPLAVAQAPLWGIGKTCAVEHPELWGGLVDLDPSGKVEEVAAQLRSCLLATDREDQVAFRAGERHVARVVRDRIPEPKPLTVHGDGAYLITGGLKGLGFEVARWLVDHGARHLILLGRSALPARESWPRLAKDDPLRELVGNVQVLERMGASVLHPAVDVTSESQMRAFFEDYARASRPVIRGVFHCAAVWTGEGGKTVILPLSMTEVSSIGHVFPPKVVGSWLLQRCLKDAPLDFFVMFSAAAGLLGSAGQLVYTAANSFVDALAHEMARQGGRRALSINWGPIKDVGSGATLEGKMMHQLAERRGLLGIPPEQALEALELLIPQGATQMGVMRTNWELLVQSYTGMLSAPWASGLVSDLPAVEQENLVLALTQAAPEERKELLCSAIQRLVSIVMGYSAMEAPEIDQGLFELGLDSLLGLELKNHIQARIRRDFPVTAIFEYPTIESLAGYLLKDVLGLPTSTIATETLVEDADVVDVIDQLSEAEVEARLARELAGNYQHA